MNHVYCAPVHYGAHIVQGSDKKLAIPIIGLHTDVKMLYRQASNMSHTESQNLMFLASSCSFVFAKSIEARCLAENKDIVGAAPTGDALTTSEWSPILLTTKLRLILEVWR